VSLNDIRGSKAAQSLRMQKFLVKKMLTAFFDAIVIIHHEFVPEKQTVKVNFIKR
jgi:hypothetical protein